MCGAAGGPACAEHALCFCVCVRTCKLQLQGLADERDLHTSLRCARSPCPRLTACTLSTRCLAHSASLSPHPPPRAGKPPPFQPQGSPAIPLLAVLALLVLAFSNLQTAKASVGGGLVAASLQAPTVLLQQVAAPLLLALAVLVLVMKKGKYLCDRPTLLPDAAVPWH